MTGVEIRELSAGDFAIVCSWLSDPSLNRWLASEWRGRSVTPAVLAAAVRSGRSRLFVVTVDGTQTGLVALSEIDQQDGVAMVWYLLGRSDLGRTGVTTAAVKSLMNVAIGEMGLRCLYAWIAASNFKSRRVLERNGFREVGRLRSATTVDGIVEDRVYFDFVGGASVDESGVQGSSRQDGDAR